MAVILLLVTFVGCGFYFFRFERNGIRDSVLLAYLAMLAFALIGTEILSIVDYITYSGVFLYWGIVLSFLVSGLYIKNRREVNSLTFRKRIKKIKEDATKFDVFFISILLFILGVTFLTAILSPPNNFDSMTYHMARVAHWIQQHNVDFFPTSIPRQNFAMPLAEYVILHIQILSRSDLYANLVQWISFCISILGVSLIVKVLQGSKYAQSFSGLLAATIPMAILQSSSTQNDLVVSALCLSFTYYLIRFARTLVWKDAVFSSWAMGLALLTKGTAYLFCAGVGLGIAFGIMIHKKRGHRRKILLLLVLIVVGALSINSGFYIRNFDLYGLPLSPENNRITVDSLSLITIYTNAIRNFAIHLVTPSAQINNGIIKAVEFLLGDYLNFPASTFENSTFRIQYLINEDYAGNIFHVALLPLGMFYFIFRNNDVESNYLHFVIGLSLSAFLFITLIKWQPWVSRLHTPLFLLSVPLIGLGIDRISTKKYLSVFIAVILFIYTLPFLFLNSTRPWIPFFEDGSFPHTNSFKRFFSNRPKLYNQLSTVLSPFYKGRSILHTDRHKLYFMSQYDYYWDYVGAMKLVNEIKPAEIGLCMDSNDWEYPFWVFTGQHAKNDGPHIFHVDVNNPSGHLDNSDESIPDYILATKERCEILGVGSFQSLFESDHVDFLKKTENGGG